MSCSGLLVADLLVFLISFGTCDEENCPTWREWVNGVTLVAGVALFVLMVSAALAILVVRAGRY